MFLIELDKRKQSFNPAQLAGLKQRLALLKTFLSLGRLTKPRFSPGHLTIIDLTDPFIDATSACSLFQIVVRLFVRAKVDTGKVLLVDEAHKVCQSYLSAFSNKSLICSISSAE